MSNPSNFKNKKSFSQKIWTGGSIIALIVLLIIAFIESLHVFILILVGALIACYFRGLGKFIEKKTGWSINLSILTSFLGTVLILSGLFYLAGSTAVNQFSELQEKFPEIIEKSERFFSDTDVGKKFKTYLDKVESSDVVISEIFKSTFGGIGDIFVIIVVGVYFTISPKIYLNGFVQLIPPKHRAQATYLIDEISVGLTRWLLGKFFAMGLIFVLTAIALAIIGLPFWLALALIAGLLVFVPNFGPIASAIPALLVALSISVNMALLVGVLYLIIQLSEGSIITPNVQNRLVKIPPALIILAQIFAYILIGIWGLIFATPIAYILMITVKELYILPMERKAKEEEQEDMSLS
ncbi:MAG TPA: AI-2E family transporter [Flavobacteriaceae bacterium]|nr:AI-2E family transporter [Flavobacteriaceae bacterium]